MPYPKKLNQKKLLIAIIQLVLDQSSPVKQKKKQSTINCTINACFPGKGYMCLSQKSLGSQAHTIIANFICRSVKKGLSVLLQSQCTAPLCQKIMNCNRQHSFSQDICPGGNQHTFQNPVEVIWGYRKKVCLNHRGSVLHHEFPVAWKCSPMAAATVCMSCTLSLSCIVHVNMWLLHKCLLQWWDWTSWPMYASHIDCKLIYAQNI